MVWDTAGHEELPAVVPGQLVAGALSPVSGGRAFTIMETGVAEAVDERVAPPWLAA